MAKRKSFSINRSLTQGLEETMHAAQDYSGELLVDVVPIHRLELDPENPRQLHLSFADVEQGTVEDAQKKRELESLHTLANSIKNQGIINPIVVYKHHDNYRLIAGERRSLASLLAGKKNIQARILEKRPDDLKRTILQWMENIEREDLTLWERLSNIRSIMQAYSEQQGKVLDRVTAAELSELIGISTSQSAQYKAVLQGPDELLEAIETNAVANLDKAAFIAKAPMKHQGLLITLCGQGAKLKEMKSAVESISIVDKPTAPTKQSTFKVAVSNERVVKAIIQSILESKNFLHLKDKVRYDSALHSKGLKKLFNQLMQELEEIVE